MKDKSVKDELKATCGKCDEVFNVKLRYNKRPEGIEVCYFKCLKCGHVYFVSATNKSIRKLHERMTFTRDALAKARRDGDEVNFNRLLDELDEMERDSKNRMDELAAKLQGGGK